MKNKKRTAKTHLKSEILWDDETFIQTMVTAIGIPQPVPAGVRLQRIPVRKRLKRCFELAGMFVLNNYGWGLVHQAYSIAGNETGHAWAEREGLVYDPIYNRFFLKSDYYVHRKRDPFFGDPFVKVGPINIYSPKEAGKNISKFKNWGPWEG
jgi:hypothetical protein